MNLIARVRTDFGSVNELLDRIQEVSDEESLLIQAFDPASILSESHLIFSAEHAFKAFAEGRGIAKKIGNEMLLRAASTRRIDEAIRRVGVKDPKNVLLFVSGKRIDAKRILRWLEAERVPLTFGSERELMKKFGLAGSRSYSVEDLLLEKIALLGLEK